LLVWRADTGFSTKKEKLLAKPINVRISWQGNKIPKKGAKSQITIRNCKNYKIWSGFWTGVKKFDVENCWSTSKLYLMGGWMDVSKTCFNGMLSAVQKPDETLQKHP
jgi:hypothetical protein